MSNSRIQTHGIAEKVLKNALSVISRCDRGEITLDDAVDLLPDDCRRIIEHLIFTFYRQRKAVGKALNKFFLLQYPQAAKRLHPRPRGVRWRSA